MKLFSKSRVLLTAASLTSIMIAGTATAEYRVTAFGYSAAYDALLSGDADSATSVLAKKPLARMDFVEANNLCIAQILEGAATPAIASCSLALEKLDSEFSLDRMTERSAKASIYSNLAVAKAMSGDMAGASSDLEAALSLNARDKNAVSNYSFISDLVPAAGIARSL